MPLNLNVSIFPQKLYDVPKYTPPPPPPPQAPTPTNKALTLTPQNWELNNRCAKLGCCSFVFWGFFKFFFWVWTIFKLFTEFATILLLFYVLVLWPWGMGISAPWPGIKPIPPALEGKVLTIGLPGKSLFAVVLPVCRGMGLSQGKYYSYYLDVAWETYCYSWFVLWDILLLHEVLGSSSSTASIKIIILELSGKGWRPREFPLGRQTAKVPLPGLGESRRK